jgi:hypothetical protein
MQREVPDKNEETDVEVVHDVVHLQTQPAELTSRDYRSDGLVEVGIDP